MNQDLLLAHFDRIGDVPDAIPRLRQFVLELAVRGKLSNRDPMDEPASALVGRIQVERDRRVRQRQIRQSGTLAEVKPEEVSFEIPENWQWARLGIISEVVMGQSPPGVSYNKSGEGIPLINGPVEFTEGPFGRTVINQYTTDPTNLCEEGDLLLCVRGSTTGRTNIAGFRACIGRGVAAIRPLFADRYVRLFIWRHRASIIAMGRGIAFPSVSRQQIENLPVPLPPLAEQNRIVATVDDLMRLCDRLEAARNEREIRQDRLAAASHYHLNNGADADAYRKHAQFFIGHLPRLTAQPDQIKQLRQTILKLAVRGKIVPQNPDDEPASELLKCIQGEKALFVKEGKMRPQPPLPAINDSQLPYRIPTTWAWARFGAIVTGADAGWSPKTEGFPKLGDNWGVLKVSAVSWNNFLPEENKQLLPGVVAPIAAEVHAGDFLISRANTSELVAKCVVVEQEPKNLILSDKIVRLQISQCCSKKFFSIVNNYAPHARAYYAEEASGTSLSMKNVSRAVIYGLLVPIPPLAEQHRIVAKIDELMALCDHLEAQLTATKTQGRRLLESVLHRTLEPI